MRGRESRRRTTPTPTPDAPFVSAQRMGVAAALLVTACSSKPPPDFAPDPGLVSRIQSIRAFVPASVCPGEQIRASYTAVLNDRSEIPFADRYDKDNPPDLHIVFLSRYSPNAVALENGNWDTYGDPLLSAMEGFKLRVAMRAKPSVVTNEVVVPDYRCARHAFRFEGERGARGRPGGPGPDVTVRLAIISSPFYDRLLVASVQVEAAPPFYLFADAETVPPADWLIVRAQGGRGGTGVNGENGEKGTQGAAGCPGGAGGAGGRGEPGGPGGAGGRGGRLTVIVPQEEPFLAGLVEAVSEGGEGGNGGRGGRGGAGGDGGEPNDRRCDAGPAGPAGEDGREGREGPDGPRGPRPQIITLPADNVFGDRVPPELAVLLRYHRGENR